MDTVAILAITALSKKILDLVKLLLDIRNPNPVARVKSINGAITILVSWLVSVIAVILVVKTVFSTSVIFGFDLGHSGIWTLVVIGLLVGSSAGLVSDTLNAVRRDPSTAHPPLLSTLVRNAQPVDTTDAGDTDATGKQ